jgi:hypothetical protein
MGDGSISLPVEAQKPAVYALADMPTPPAETITDRRRSARGWNSSAAHCRPASRASPSSSITADSPPS